MILNLKKKIFIPKPFVDLLRKKMGATVHYKLDLAESVVMPDQYAGEDNAQILVAYLYSCGALSDEDAATIVERSRFSSIKELADHWRSEVDNRLIDAE